MKKVIIYILIFILIGELMIRFQNYFLLLEENKLVKIETNIEITPEYQLLKNNNFPINENDLRIMVIGDSYIHGGGIEFSQNFSQQLKNLFQDNKNSFDKNWVLDVSKSNSNNFDNNQTYFEFVDEFEPNIVILGYNLNDIDGNLEEEILNTSDNKGFKKNKSSGGVAKSKIRKIYKLIYNSQFFRFSFKKMHSYLKTYGVILPNSRFDITMKSYYQNRESWRKSKIILHELIQHAESNRIQIIVYKFPEINLLEQPELFSKANSSIQFFFKQFPGLIYVNGGDVFKGQESDNFILSKYDGHPNEKAHKVMAEHVYQIIKKNDGF